MRAFTIYAATLNDTLLDQIDSFDLDAGLEHFVQHLDGGVDPVFTAVKGQQPKISLSTTGVAKALAVCSIDGLQLTDGIFYFQQLSNGGTREGGAAHLMLAADSGLVLPRSLSAGHDEVATLSYEILLLSAGGNAPLVATKNQTLNADPSADELFVAGPASINGVALTGVQSINIEFGINEILLGGDGDVYSSFAAIMTRQPKITIELSDMDLLADLGIGGAAQGTIASRIYLRKVAKDGLRVADAAAEHICISIDAGRIHVKEGGGKPSDPARVTLEINPVYDGTNDILAINTAATIT